MSRNITGFVRGGMQNYALPPSIQPGDLATHAVGRVDTMSEILVQAAFLRSTGVAGQATGFGKAVFQDVTGNYSGTDRIQAAHRALFALELDGMNAAHIPHVFSRPRLRGLVIAPQARTDLVIRPVNYADQLVEDAISGRMFQLFRMTMMRQSPGRPIERNLLVDSSHALKRLLEVGYGEALEAFHRNMRESHWQEHRPGQGLAPLAGVTDAEIDRFSDKAFGGVMSIQVSGPKKFGNLTEVVLGISKEITQRATPIIAQGNNLEALVDSISQASDLGTIESYSR